MSLYEYMYANEFNFMNTMKENILKPFNLKEALEGKPVITRDGKEVTQLHEFKTNGTYKIYGVTGNFVSNWDASGYYDPTGNHPKDLFMAPTKTKYYVHVIKPRDHSDTIYSVGPTKCPWENVNHYGNLIQTFEFEIDE